MGKKMGGMMSKMVKKEMKAGKPQERVGAMAVGMKMAGGMKPAAKKAAKKVAMKK